MREILLRRVQTRPSGIAGGSTLHLDTSLYTPSPGDAWIIINHGTGDFGSLQGTFGNVTSDSPGTLSLALDYSDEQYLWLHVSALQELPPELPGLGKIGVLTSLGLLFAVDSFYLLRETRAQNAA
jgi:hypothetical protein